MTPAAVAEGRYYPTVAGVARADRYVARCRIAATLGFAARRRARCPR